MKRDVSILELYGRRLEAYQELKTALQEQQKQLVNYDAAEIRRAAVAQVNRLESLDEREAAWRNALESLFPQGVPRDPFPAIVKLCGLNENEQQVLMELRHQLRTTLRDIRELKEANQLLLENGLAFLRTFSRYITEGDPSKAVYHPQKKTLPANRLINRTF